MLKRFILLTHRYLGIPLSFVFLLWFLSGFVMIFNGSFPRARKPITHTNPTLQSGIDLLPIDSLIANLPDSFELSQLSLIAMDHRPILEVSARDRVYRVYADTNEPVSDSARCNMRSVVEQWCTAPIEKIDTLHSVDQWIPFERYEKDMPVFKYYFDDKEKHQLYITQDGKVIQFSSRKERIVASFGSIPHWLYFTFLRKHQEAWTNTVKWLALTGCVVCLTGFIAAFMIWCPLWKSKGFFHNPFKKFWWRWHFITGLLFGLFAITFAFSGYMSMAEVPSFLKKTPPGTSQETMERKERTRGHHAHRDAIRIQKYPLDYRRLLTSDSITSIEWSNWKGEPYYRINYLNSNKNVSVLDKPVITPFVLTKTMILADLKKEVSDSIGFVVDKLNEFDDDYFSRGTRMAPLPVYRVVLDDYLHTHYYYSLSTLTVRKVDDNDRTRRFLYSGLHRLHFKFLYEHMWLWYTVMFLIMIGGTALSLTSVILSLQWLKRRVHPRDSIKPLNR